MLSTACLSCVLASTAGSVPVPGSVIDFDVVERTISFRLVTPAVPGPGTVLLQKTEFDDSGDGVFDDVIALGYNNTKLDILAIAEQESFVGEDSILYTGIADLSIEVFDPRSQADVEASSNLFIRFDLEQDAMLHLAGGEALPKGVKGGGGVVPTPVDVPTVSQSYLTIRQGAEIVFSSYNASQAEPIALPAGDDYVLDVGSFAMIELDGQGVDVVEFAGQWFELMATPIEPDDRRDPDCAFDLNGDGDVDSLDFNELLGAFGNSKKGDVTGDGKTNTEDLQLLLAAWGNSCDDDED